MAVARVWLGSSKASLLSYPHLSEVSIISESRISLFMFGFCLRIVCLKFCHQIRKDIKHIFNQTKGGSRRYGSPAMSSFFHHTVSAYTPWTTKTQTGSIPLPSTPGPENWYSTLSSPLHSGHWSALVMWQAGLSWRNRNSQRGRCQVSLSQDNLFPIPAPE